MTATTMTSKLPVFRSERARVVVEDVTFMLDMGESFENACNRMKLTRNAVEQAFHRAGLRVPRGRR